MKENRIFQSYHEYFCGEGKAKINIYNGNLQYEYPILTEGERSFKLNIGIFYNSYYKKDNSFGKKYGFLSQWKFNFEQFLFKYKNDYNLNGFFEDDYVLIDSNWNIHRFHKYVTNKSGDNITSIYYDDSGTGQKLYITDDIIFTIVDENNNKYCFENEKLVKVISGINDLICKEIKYENGLVKEVYDKRKEYRKIKFNYNVNDLPIKIYSTNSDIYYVFEYNNNLLTNIIKCNYQSSKLLQTFMYDENYNLETTVNNENLFSLSFEYKLQENSYQVVKVINRVAKRKALIESGVSEKYLGENYFIGNDYYLTGEEKIYKGKSLIFPKNYINEFFSYVYNVSYTEMTNNKNSVINRYSFDIKGRNISNLEKKNNNFCTLTRENGFKISSICNSNIKFNGEFVTSLQNINGKFSYEIENSKLDEFKKIFEDHTDEDVINDKFTDLFHLSFWLMFQNNNNSTLVANLKYELDGGDYEESIVINETLTDSWQKVKLPLYLKNVQKSLKNLKIIFEIDDSKSLTDQSILLGDIRINRGGMQNICIDNTIIGNDQYKVLSLGKKLFIKEENEDFVILSPDYYITNSDIIATYRSLFYSKKNGEKYFDLYFCNKTKVKAVEYVYLDNKETDEYKFIIDHEEIPNYHLRMAKLYETDKWLVTELQRRFHYDDNLQKYYYEVKKSVGIVDCINKEKRLNDNNSSLTYVWINEDGLERAHKYTKLQENNKRISNIIHKFYDSFGNIVGITSYDEDNPSGEKISVQYNYVPDQNGIELLNSVLKDDTTINIQYDEKNNMIGISDERNLVKLIYNDFNELLSIEFIDNMRKKVIGKNDFKYNKGNLSVIKDLSDICYGFQYNIFSELNQVRQNKNKLFDIKEKIENKKEEEIINIYKNKNNPNIIKNIYDEYERIKKNQIDSDVIEFQYECNDELSNQLMRINKITDPYSDMQIDIMYDDDNRSLINNIVSIGNEMKIKNYKNNSKVYQIFDQEEYKVQHYKVDEISKNVCNVVNYFNNNSSSKWEELLDFSNFYEYDCLGRLLKKQYYTIPYEHANINIEQLIGYKKNTKYRNETKYVIKSVADNEKVFETHIIYTDDYVNDDIIESNEQGTRFVEPPIDENTIIIADLNPKKVTYKYDSFNRLIEENNSEMGKYEYFYGDKSNRVEKIIKNGEVKIEFEYVAGKLTKKYDDGIIKPVIYDDIGNIISFNSNNYVYNNRNLLSSVSLNNGNKIDYFYNSNGFRFKKNIENDKTIKYLLDGNRVIGENWYSSSGQLIEKIRYFYDVDGVCGIRYNNHNFTLVKDSIGNISKVMYRGKTIGEYIYDAWGNCIVKPLSICQSDEDAKKRDTFVLYNNPFRYNGYYFDIETNMYYCGSRYYNSGLYQWMSPDKINFIEIDKICGLNLYRYCNDNPVKYVDYFGFKAMKKIDKNLEYRIDNKGTPNEHIHVVYNNVKYSRYLHPKTQTERHKGKESSNIPKTAKEILLKNRVNPDYFNNIVISTPTIDDYFSPFPISNPEIFVETLPYNNNEINVTTFPVTPNEGNIETIPQYETESFIETFPLEEVGKAVVVVVVVAAVVYAAACIIGAFFTGGQSLWGLLAFA